MGAATTDTRVVVGGLMVLSNFLLRVPNRLSDRRKCHAMNHDMISQCQLYQITDYDIG